MAPIPVLFNRRVVGALAATMLAPIPFVASHAIGTTDLSPVVAQPPVPGVEPRAPFPDLSEELNDRVDYWIGRFTSDQRRTFEIFLAQEGAFGDLIREKLRSRGMPDELIYLAMIESGFRPRATSRVQAAGVWQFMGPTAQAYGLRVDDWVDERRDPLKATDAALDYLAWLHDLYGSWSLAAAAYNAGPTRVNRALERAGLDRDAVRAEASEEVFWQIRSHLPRETREYVPRLFAAAFLAERVHDHGFQDVDKARPYEYDQVWVPGGTELQAVATSLEQDYTIMRALNPHLIRGVTPPGSGAYPLRVPVGSAPEIVASLARRPGEARSRRADDDD